MSYARTPKTRYALLSLLCLTSVNAWAEVPEYRITIKEHRFEPAEIEIPADTKVKLIVKNEDDSAEEFESHDFNREKIIKGKSEAKIFVGPLEPGSYGFFGEFHPETAQGKVIVK